MRILSFVGTRPEVIKNLALVRAARDFDSIELLIAHSGQNFGLLMADVFLKELGIPLQERNPSFDYSSYGAVAQSLLDYILGTIKKYSPDIIISNTDTDTAFFTALAGSRLRVPVAHIEGGIRCEAPHNPEEINRRLADHLADWIFTISDEDTDSLLKEGVSRDRIFMLGDITLDALMIISHEHGIKVNEGDYDLLTIHRQENTNHKERLLAILEGVIRGGHSTVFPVHPRTRQALENFSIWQNVLKSKNIRVMEPQGYIDMLRLLAGSRKVISDSGGLRREAYMLDKPVISLVPFVWFKKMNQLGFEFTADDDTDKLSWAIQNYSPSNNRPPIFGDGKSAHAILKVLSAIK